METVMGHETVVEGIEQIGKGLVQAKDLALLVEHRLQEYGGQLEAVGQAIGALHVHIQHLDHLIEHADKLTHQ